MGLILPWYGQYNVNMKRGKEHHHWSGLGVSAIWSLWSPNAGSTPRDLVIPLWRNCRKPSVFPPECMTKTSSRCFSRCFSAHRWKWHLLGVMAAAERRTGSIDLWFGATFLNKWVSLWYRQGKNQFCLLHVHNYMKTTSCVDILHDSVSLFLGPINTVFCALPKHKRTLLT